MNIRAEKNGFAPELSIYIEDNRGFVKPEDFIFTEKKEGEFYVPTTYIGLPDAQVLMDDLWRAGLRPSEGTGSAGSLAATERHLKDLQKIVYKKLGL